MRLFASTTLRTRCASARLPSSSHRGRDALEKKLPSSLLAHKLTKPKPASAASRKASGRGKNSVHPIDLRDLEGELDLLLDSVELIPIPASVSCRPPLDTTPRSYTASITVHHALDLHNPCQIRSCPHGFLPHAQLSVDGLSSAGFDAARHAKNHSSWSKAAHITHYIADERSTRIHLLRVDVAAQCTRHPHDPVLVPIGHTDDIALSLDPSGGTVSQFYPVFRYQSVQKRMVKYFAGKIKLTISITPDSSPSALRIEPVTAKEAVSVYSPSITPERRALLPVNFGDALQLKRQQLKATVAPAVINHALTKSENDPEKTRTLMQRLQTIARGHVVRLCDVEVLEAIGEGVHARVCRARIEGIANDAAMKEFRYETASSLPGSLPPLAVLQAFQQEYEMLSLISSSDSPESSRGEQTLCLLGVLLTPQLAIFTDFCSDGSLARCVLDHTLWSQVSQRTKLALAHQLATGLANLHSLHVVHRDIKTHNIMVHGLLSQRPIAKIGDLGSAVIKRPADAMLHEETGSSGYTAPEVFGSDGYDHCADIWSLGIVVWELLIADPVSGDVKRLQNPFVGACGDEVVRKAQRGERPEIPRDRSLSSSFDSLLRRCWDLDPSRRPTAADMAVELARLDPSLH